MEQRSSGWQLEWAVLVLLLALHSQPVAAHPHDHHNHHHIEVMSSCGTSRTTRVSCLVDSSTLQVLDVRLENADGELSSVCSLPDNLPGTRWFVYSLAEGDNIYGVQACYKNNSTLAGVTFSAASGPKICGNPQAEGVVCKSTVVSQPAPMAAMFGNCNSDGITLITRVCFNPFFINPDVPIQACPAGQGRISGQEPCKPCPRNHYNPGGVYGQCLRCPPDLVTISEGASRCGCPPGYGANPDRTTIPASPACTPCAPGSYYPGGNVEPCWRCRGSAFLTTQPGASSIVQCVCAPGYGASSTAPNTCQPCPKGTWSNALAEVQLQNPQNSLVRFPPGVGNGKGKGGCYTCNPSWKECTSCCEASTRTCDLTTAFPGAKAASQCVKASLAGGSNSTEVVDVAVEEIGVVADTSTTTSSSSSSSSSSDLVSSQELVSLEALGG